MKKFSLNLLYSIIISVLIILMCSISEKTFFFVDDAQNEFLPFLREIGKIWLNGEIPFILKDTFIGSNTMIEIHRAIFLPQNIILSIISNKLTSLIAIANISAFINLMIISFSSLKIAEVLNFSKKLGILLSLLFCSNPIVLYIYLGSWWNGASGQAWFIASLATILYLRKDFSIKNLFLNFICTSSILLSGWPHASIAYAVLAFIFLLELLKLKKFKLGLTFCIHSLGTILFVIPNYSEYIVSSNLISRPFDLGNYDNFLVMPLNQIIISFSPVYYNFIHIFGGYKLVLIPLGYTSIFTLLAVCFTHIRNIILAKDCNIPFFILLLICFFILTQSPSALGPTRWPFRFYPFFAEISIITSLYILQNTSFISITKLRIKVFIGIILTSSLLAIFSQVDFRKITLVNLFFVAITLSYLYYFITTKKINSINSGIYIIFCLGLTLFVQNSSIGYISMPYVKNEISTENYINNKGYVLSLTNGKDPKNNIQDLNSAQFLLYGIKSINGASPVGNIEISKLLSTYSSQAYFNSEDTIKNLSRKSYNQCYFSLMNIESVILNKDNMNNDVIENLNTCGFVKNNETEDVLFFKKPNYIDRGNISYLSDGLELTKIEHLGYNYEKYLLSSSNNNGFVIFSRVYWKGYKAFFNGKEQEVELEHGLVKVKINEKSNDGILELKYSPSSWSFTIKLSLIGFLLVLLALFIGNRNEK